MTTTSVQTDRLAALVESRFEVLSLLVRLAEEQLALIEAANMGPLMKLLADKQSLLTQLADVERQLDPFRADDPDKRRWRTPEARAACQRNAELAAQRLAELIELERLGESELVRRRDGRAARLQGVHSPAEAERAYAAAPGIAACGLDFCDEG
jgi:flagellar biosynthesis/type III secretory pathway chaperone